MRRLRLPTATIFALYCSAAFGVGLGELELNSALNQRLDAEITLTNIGALEETEILSNLASQADFDRVGVERNYQLTDLRFNVRVREDGQYIVHVTSRRPVREPFLNFVVEAIWPTGRILSEYTVLLDPPVFGSDRVEKINPGEASSSASLATSSSSRQSRPERRSIPAAPAVSSGGTEGVVTRDDEFGITGPGDTLWVIALKVRPSKSVSVQQTMLALQRANPEAFINNNINLLKAGHVLRIPDMSEIRAENTSDAVADVKVQNEQFHNYKAGEVTPLEDRRTARRDPGADDVDEDGELRVLAADQPGSRAGGDDARVGQLEDSLSVAREDLDRARRANSELNVRLDGLASQVETLNEIVKLKDDQLAALRAELQRALATQPSIPAATTPTQQAQTTSLLSNPMVLIGLAVVLIGGIAAAMILLRKRRQSAEFDDDSFPSVSLDEQEAAEEADDGDAEESQETTAEEEEEDIAQQTSDVIGEAEIYIAYGRFPQAISFLQNAIENESGRADIQLKLLEVYVQTEDATAFNLQLEQLKLLGDDDAVSKAMELQRQIPGAAESSAASMDATIVSPEPIEAIAESGDDDDDDLSFDLGEAMEWGDADPDPGLDTALDEAAADDAGDDDLDMDLDDDLDLDLSDDLDLGEVLDLDDDGDELDLGGDDDTLELDLDADDDFDLGELEDDLGELNVNEDASSKLNLARAYVEMGDNDGARELLEEVAKGGTDEEIAEANELLGKVD